jgi:hypothetical protein
MRTCLHFSAWGLPALAAAALLCPDAGLTFPPAPSHRIYGTVRNEYGEPLTQTTAQILFTSSSGVQITGNIDPALEPGVNYQLTVAIDSGTAADAYKPTALKPAAPFRIQVKIGSAIYLPLQMTGNYATLGEPAKSTRIDLTLGEDADGDGIPDAWQRLLKSILGNNAKTGPNDDADGDGISNLNEYLAGTYAFDPADGFKLDILVGASGRPEVEFTVVNPRTYTLYSSSDMKTWIPVNFTVPADGTDAALRQNYVATDIRPLRVAPAAPSLSETGPVFYKVLVQ